MSREATQYQKNAVHHAVVAGIALLWAKRRLAWYRKNKKKLPGGMPAPKWRDWLKENFDGSQSTAKVYMRLARKWKTYQWIVNSPNVSIRQLVALMTTKKGDEPSADESKPKQELTEEDLLNEIDYMRESVYQQARTEIQKWSPAMLHFVNNVCTDDVWKMLGDHKKKVGKLADVFWKQSQLYDEAQRKLGSKPKNQEVHKLYEEYKLEVLKEVATNHRQYTPYQKAVVLRHAMAFKNHPEGKELYRQLEQYKDEEAAPPVTKRKSGKVRE
jgi:hypothetical protein